MQILECDVASMVVSCSSGGSVQETDCQHQEHNLLLFSLTRESHVLQQRMVQYLEPRLGVRLNYITSGTYVFVSQHVSQYFHAEKTGSAAVI